MIEAAAMLAGLWALWLLLTQQWRDPEEFAMAAGAALLCTLIALLAGVRGIGAFARAPQLIVLALGRSGDVFASAMSTVRAAIAADVTLRPALVRLKTRPASDTARAAFASFISSAPGAVVADADENGLLVHVLDEEDVEASALVTLEGRVIHGVDGRQA